MKSKIKRRLLITSAPIAGVLLVLFLQLRWQQHTPAPQLSRTTTTIQRQLQQQNDPTDDDDLQDCLKRIPNDPVVVVPSDDENNNQYQNAVSCHNSRRGDRVWTPKAVVKVSLVEQVAAAVQCAAAHSGITVTARSGAHGFENEACSGHIIIDVSLLDDLTVDTDNKIVTFGSGHLHGQLYHKLVDYGLVVPGGTENSVGTAGLWLGCGRGLLTQLYGMTCDNVLSVEFVDVNGNLRFADSSTDQDMFWMARGSGGEFPGIVTKFVVKAYDMPTQIYTVTAYFDIQQIRELIRAWVERIEEMSEPTHSMFAFIRFFLGELKLEMTCYSCDKDQMEFFMTQYEEIVTSAGSDSGTSEWTGNWLDRLLLEPWDGYDTEDDLREQSEWPEVWEVMSNGGHMVPTTDVSDAMLDAIEDTINRNTKTFTLYLYSMSGSHIANVPSTQMAYGGRSAKYVLHYKFYGDTALDAKFPLRDFAMSLDNAGLPCKGFYNYADREFPCAAGSGDLWLEAHFSDVERMKAIKEVEDPEGLFMSSLKAKKWKADSNEYTFVGWPNVGDMGGMCTCPDGAIYQVGDNNDECQSLACVGGVPGSCLEDNPGGAGFRVVCDVTMTTPNPTKTTTEIITSEPTIQPSTLSPSLHPTVPATPALTPQPSFIQTSSLPTISQSIEWNASTITTTNVPTMAITSLEPSIDEAAAPNQPPQNVLLPTLVPVEVNFSIPTEDSTTNSLSSNTPITSLYLWSFPALYIIGIATNILLLL